MSDRLIIKATFLLGDKLRTNNLKIKMLGEEVQMFLDNGHSRNGTKKFAHFRMDQKAMKQLMEFLQNNLK